ncbi:hypothetical protein DMH01_42405, partial [Amycolatopsis sp. WAC 04182]|uniref:DUF2637 domain-containing protein n=1 Tax=Amycolatopsis sp. WAC 04182 TaxID=2203198 RepID=UPI000F78BBA9
GWTASFIGLHEFATKHMGYTESEAWLVPLTFDGGAFALSISAFRAARNGRAAPLRRLLVIVFTLGSSVINYNKLEDTSGRWVNALLPVVAVIVFESVLVEARKAYERNRQQGNARPKIHPLRWFFDRDNTIEIYKSYVLGTELPEHLREAATTVAEQQAAAKPQRRSTKKPVGKAKNNTAKPKAVTPASPPRAIPANPAPLQAEEEPTVETASDVPAKTPAET